MMGSGTAPSGGSCCGCCCASARDGNRCSGGVLPACAGQSNNIVTVLLDSRRHQSAIYIKSRV